MKILTSYINYGKLPRVLIIYIFPFPVHMLPFFQFLLVLQVHIVQIFVPLRRYREYIKLCFIKSTIHMEWYLLSALLPQVAEIEKSMFVKTANIGNTSKISIYVK